MSAEVVFLAAAAAVTAVQIAAVVLVARALIRWVPRSVDGWIGETLQVTHRVPATGALYAAALVSFLWLRVRL